MLWIIDKATKKVKIFWVLNNINKIFCKLSKWRKWKKKDEEISEEERFKPKIIHIALGVIILMILRIWDIFKKSQLTLSG